MNLKEALRELESLGSEKMRAHNKKRGAGDNQFGVQMGDIRKVAKKIKTDHELAMALWKTGNIDAQFLAVLVMQPKILSAKELDDLVRSVTFLNAADWLTSYVVKLHPDKESLRREWMTESSGTAARAGWSLTAERVAKNPDGIDLTALLDRLEKEMGTAPPEVQWTMNFALAETGIHHAEYRERAIEIGEKLGIYRDYPCAKGCTSPFAPVWINAIVSRKE